MLNCLHQPLVRSQKANATCRRVRTTSTTFFFYIIDHMSLLQNSRNRNNRIFKLMQYFCFEDEQKDMTKILEGGCKQQVKYSVL